MKKKNMFLLLIVFLNINCSCDSMSIDEQPKTDGEKKTYSVTIHKIANMGLLVEYDSKFVMIDGLFNNVFPEYEYPSTDKMDKLLSNENVNHVLITHGHADHFDESLVLEYVNSREVICILPGDLSLGTINWRNAGESSQNEAIYFTSLNMYEPTVFESDYVMITSFRIPHVGTSPVANNGYLFEFKNGFRLLHTGDGDITTLNDDSLSWIDLQNIDVAIFPFFEIGEHYKNVEEFGITTIIPMHYDKRFGNLESLINEIPLDNIRVFGDNEVLRF